ncbi:hypothetical protein COW99_01235 [Candidatus Roizmanbacteria bacterium CG22_combo_CG10-13_8_21_14_all_38_20]|uniref:Pilus assembly protein PilN n=1 Tax=Candidatus Roizmanbacteria bacterium CG22_combo_CG10-13_8_21_14_all_38_20 TaxID=1974862 RepID=A0A2H0BWE4_9BACT|nr:hypothetical protein [Candidatus Microgenomates bacterium]PIP62006.1 MAG: hypothetical protein COW99_01235 [Candidatus Roizmanbacteria bacterium CG22_combo_CG10-13_8_21_14_all_38_20]PJC31335.1 MAG: hypothetical protein CO050_03660 [Candidatus Roizmanbacteria bacterium CG_4_9_14_0_2_um_filter_38_17]
MSAQINLLPKKGFANSALGSILEFFSTYGRYIIVGTQLIVLIAFFSRFKLDRELTDLRDAVDQKKAIITDLQIFESEVRLLQQRLKNIRDLKQGHDFVRDTLSVVKTVLPPGTVLEDLNIQAYSFGVDGISQDQQAFADLIITLRKSEELDNILFSNISKSADSEIIEFSFSADMKDYSQQNPEGSGVSAEGGVVPVLEGVNEEL